MKATTNNKKKRNFSINLPEELIKEIDEEAKKESRSRSSIIEILLQTGLEFRFRKNRQST